MYTYPDKRRTQSSEVRDIFLRRPGSSTRRTTRSTRASPRRRSSRRRRRGRRNGAGSCALCILTVCESCRQIPARYPLFPTLKLPPPHAHGHYAEYTRLTAEKKLKKEEKREAERCGGHRIAALIPPPRHLGISKGAPLRLPKPHSNQFPVRVCSCAFWLFIVCESCGQIPDRCSPPQSLNRTRVHPLAVDVRNTFGGLDV